MTPEIKPTEQYLKQLYGEYLEYSYRYYILDQSVVTDDEFNSICATLLMYWDSFEHILKHLTDKDLLTAGTGYHVNDSTLPVGFVRLIKLHPNRPLREIYHQNSSPRH